MANAPKRYPVAKVKPFVQDDLWNDKKYSVQGMLTRQVNFPEFYYEGDDAWDVWTDRMRVGFKYAYDTVLKPANIDGNFETLFHTLPAEIFLKYMQALIAPTYHEWRGNGTQVNWEAQVSDWHVGALEQITLPPLPTGARTVRYSDQGGYPVYRLDIIFKSPNTPEWRGYSSSRNAPNIEGSYRNGMRTIGPFSYHCPYEDF